MSTTLILLAGVAAFAFIVMRAAGRGDIRGADARALVGGGARLLDVRTPGEFAGGHLPGAINVPLDQLRGRLDEVGPPDRAVVVYCATGMRSATAKRVLERAGFTRVRNLGPTRAW